MPQLIDSQTCEGVGWNPRLYSGVREKTGRFEYWLWNPSPQGGWECHFRTKDRQKAIRLFRHRWLVIDWRYPKMLIWIGRNGSVVDALWIKGSYWDWAFRKVIRRMKP